MTILIAVTAAANLVCFIFRALRWARKNDGFSAFVAGAHLTMALALAVTAMATA